MTGSRVRCANISMHVLQPQAKTPKTQLRYISAPVLQLNKLCTKHFTCSSGVVFLVLPNAKCVCLIRVVKEPLLNISQIDVQVLGKTSAQVSDMQYMFMREHVLYSVMCSH